MNLGSEALLAWLLRVGPFSVFNAVPVPVNRSTRPTRHRAAAALALSGSFVTAPSAAQAPPEPTHFELRAPESCINFEDFAAQVRKRSARILLVAGPAARSLIVQIRQQGSGVVRGSVRVVEPGVATRSRQLKASSCAEAVDALSLIATVTLDPDALLAEPEPEPEPEPQPPPEPKRQPEPKPAQAARPRARSVPRRPLPLAPDSRGQGAPYRFSFGAGAALLVNQAPDLAPGGTSAVALEVRPGRVLAPFVRLSLLHAQRRNILERGSYANFAFTLPTLDVCPVRLGPRRLGIRPCAYASVGLLEVWGAAAAASQSHSRLSASAGGSLWIGLRISEVFEIVADGRVGTALSRDRFAFDERVFFTTPRAVISAGLGLAVGFP